MRKLYLFISFTFISLMGMTQSPDAVVGVSPFSSLLMIFNSTNFQLVHSVAPTATGTTITGLNGLAKHPVSGTNYTIYKASGVTGRLLGKINVVTGVITPIGNLGDNFSSITFAGDTLFGVTGDGANTPETLYRIDTVSAATTLYRTLGNGADGEVICYNPSDGMIYHWSGNSSQLFEKFLASSPTSPIVPISPSTGGGEVFGAMYLPNNSFLIADINSDFLNMSTTGTVGSVLGTSSNNVRGMIPYSCSRSVSGNPSYCFGDSTELTASSALSYQWLLNGNSIPGATNQNYFASTNGSYTCIVQDFCGTDTIPSVINVNQASTPSVAIQGASSVCAGDSVLLTGSSGGTSQWYLNGTPIAGATTNSFYASQPGVYNMTKTNLSGCSDSASVGISFSVNALPNVTLTVPSSNICSVDPAFNLVGTPPGGAFSGPGVVGTNFDPSAANLGWNIIVYSYTDGNNCSNTSTDSIQVVSCLGIQELTSGAISIFPVPASEFIQINFAKPRTETLYIFDIHGKIVEQMQVDQMDKITLNTKSYRNGTYIIKVDSQTTKFVVKH